MSDIIMAAGYKQLAKDYDRAVEQNKKLKNELAEAVMILNGQSLELRARMTLIDQEIKLKNHALESVRLAVETMDKIYYLEPWEAKNCQAIACDTLAKLKERHQELTTQIPQTPFVGAIEVDRKEK